MQQKNKKEPAVIPFFVHENDMMHKEMDMEKLQQECKEAHKEAERAHKTTRILCWTFLAIVVVFCDRLYNPDDALAGNNRPAIQRPCGGVQDVWYHTSLIMIMKQS